MTIIRFIYDNLWREGTILTQSSEHAQFPADNTQDDLKSLAYRSRHGTASGNGYFVVAATNKYIDFDEGGAELTATITPGVYNGQTLVTEVNTQLEVVGALTYTSTYSESTGKFTLIGSGNFTIRWQSGTNTANNAAGLLGFDKTANDTGADTYTGDYISIHTLESINNDLGAALEYDFIGILNHNLTSAAAVTIYGADDDAFTTNVVTDVLTYNANNIYEFLGTARTRQYVQARIVDPKNPSCYVQIGTIVIGKYFQPNRGFGKYSENDVDESETEKSASMSLFLVQEREILTNWSLPFSGLNSSSIATVKMIRRNNGIKKALIFCTDSGAANISSNWAILKESSPTEFDTLDYGIWVAELEEVI